MNAFKYNSYFEYPTSSSSQGFETHPRFRISNERTTLTNKQTRH